MWCNILWTSYFKIPVTDHDLIPQTLTNPAYNIVLSFRLLEANISSGFNYLLHVPNNWSTGSSNGLFLITPPFPATCGRLEHRHRRPLTSVKDTKGFRHDKDTSAS
ncbi:hypothetical protein J6590_039719 [Homalodisca vitripennis]|nr:hypothetical protein J6590_039719 [Homalodisca vitripennis]